MIIKVVPTSSHLKEIRQLAQDQLTKQSYSNQEILEHFEDHCQILSSETVSLTKSLTPEERQALLAMTPLLFTLTKKKLTGQLTEITIEAELLVGKSRYKGLKVKRLRRFVSAFYSSSACSVMTCKALFKSFLLFVRFFRVLLSVDDHSYIPLV